MPNTTMETGAGAGTGGAAGAQSGSQFGPWGALIGGIVGTIGGGVGGYLGNRGRASQQQAADEAAARQQAAIQEYQTRTGQLGTAAAGKYQTASKDYSSALTDAAQRYATQKSPQQLQQQYQQQALQSLQARGQMPPQPGQIGMGQPMTGAQRLLAEQQMGYANQRATNMSMPQDYERAVMMRRLAEGHMMDDPQLTQARSRLSIADTQSLQSVEHAMMQQRLGVAQSQYQKDMANAQLRGQDSLLASQVIMAMMAAGPGVQGQQGQQQQAPSRTSDYPVGDYPKATNKPDPYARTSSAQT